MENRRIQVLILSAIVILVIIVGVAAILSRNAPREGTASATLANPAAEYCKKMNNRYEIRAAADGSQYGVCILPEGTECDEWAYYRGECPASAKSGTPSPDLAENYCLSNNNMYQTRKDAAGNEVGVCILPSGKECDALGYYKGTCNESTTNTP